MVQSPYPQVGYPPHKNNHNRRGSPQGARSPSPTLNSPVQRVLQREDKTQECLALKAGG